MISQTNITSVQTGKGVILRNLGGKTGGFIIPQEISNVNQSPNNITCCSI